MSRRRPFGRLLLAAALFVGAVACSATSPEAARTREGGPGADIGNRGNPPEPGIAPSPPPSIPITSTPVPKPAATASPTPPGNVGEPTNFPATPNASPPPDPAAPGAPALPTVRPQG